MTVTGYGSFSLVPHVMRIIQFLFRKSATVPFVSKDIFGAYYSGGTSPSVDFSSASGLVIFFPSPSITLRIMPSFMDLSSSASSICGRDDGGTRCETRVTFSRIVSFDSSETTAQIVPFYYLFSSYGLHLPLCNIPFFSTEVTIETAEFVILRYYVRGNSAYVHQS